MSEVCVVHLVWKPLGLAPLRNFVESYRRNNGGLRHRLVLAFNGFADEAELREYHEVLEGIEYEWFRVYPSTQDIPVYFAAARKFENRFFCFVNSHSVLLDASWLAKLYGQITQAGVGLVGATGSWASHFSIARWEFGLPSAYDEWLRDLRLELLRNSSRAFELSPELKARIAAMPKLRRMRNWIYYDILVRGYYVVKNRIDRRRERIERLGRFPASEYSPYPAPHLRTNVFMISRELMLDLKVGHMPTKDDAYRFESGKNGLTAQVGQRRLKVLVVGRDGRGYEEDEWPISNTFWQSQQENLLVSDNNTRQYAEGDAIRKKFLSRFAWGWEAAPSGEAANGTHLSRSAWEPQAAPTSQPNRAGNA